MMPISLILKHLAVKTKTAFLVALGVVLACAAGELLVRIGTADQRNYVIEMWRYAKLLKQPSANPLVGHEHRPGHSATLEGVEVSINSLGMRGPEPLPTDKVKRRIVILGDSFAFGWGVPDSDCLRGQLAKRLPPSTEVLNGGVGNMNLLQIVAHWEDLSNKVRADTVILLPSPRAPELAQNSGGGWLVRHSMLAALLVTYGSQLASGANGRDQLIDAYRRDWTSGRGAALMSSALDRLAARQKQQGFRVIVAQLPDSHDFNNYRFGFIGDTMGRAAAAHGWAYVDLLPLFKGPPSSTYWVSKGDLHLNGKAFSLIADRLLPLVRQ